MFLYRKILRFDLSLGSFEFIYLFLPLFCAAYYLMPAKWRNALLLAGSCAFYVFSCLSCPSAIALLALSALVNWALGITIESRGKNRKIWLWLGVAFNIGILFFFKYISSISQEALGFLGKIGFSTVALPLGISFYSFRAVSYLADVYHARCYAEENFGRFALWLSFFPTVLQGPLTRYPAMKPEFDRREYSAEKFVAGLKIFVLGLGYKVLIADRLIRMWQKVCELGWDSVSTPLAWLSIVAYSLYIYFDFAGYSMMAIGVGRMLGFELPENFRWPYASKSMTEFWRRWHITLGAWFRDYIYIPLGGSRNGLWRTLVNLMCVWVFTGIWHGSSWNFVIWGVGLGLIVIAEKLWLKKYLDKWPALGHVYMAILIPLSWAVFAVTDLGALGQLFGKLFPFGAPESEALWKERLVYYIESYWPYLTAGLACCFGIPEWLHKKFEKSILWTIVLIAIFVLSVWFIFRTGSDPFAYGNF